MCHWGQSLPNWNMDGSNMVFQNNIIFRNYHFIVFNGEGRVERGRGKLYTAFHPTHVIKCLSFCLDIFSKTKTFDIWDRYILRKRILQKDFHQVLCHSGKIIRRLAAVSILRPPTFHIAHLNRYVRLRLLIIMITISDQMISSALRTLSSFLLAKPLQILLISYLRSGNESKWWWWWKRPLSLEGYWGWGWVGYNKTYENCVWEQGMPLRLEEGLLGPWVAVGGSYPGSLAGWLRQPLFIALAS